MKVCRRWYTGRSVYFPMDIGSMLKVEVHILYIMYYTLYIGAFHLLASMGGGAVVSSSWWDESGSEQVFQVGWYSGSYGGRRGGRHIYQHGC
jgi:hypothetical protein